MANELRLDYEGIDNSRQALLQQFEVFNECYKTMDSIVKALPTYWSGDTAVSYGVQFDDLAPSFNNISQLIESLAKQLQDISSNFAEADSGMSSQVNAY